MHYLFYVTKYIHVIHTLASHLRDKQGNWGQSGVEVSKPAGYAVSDGNMSSSVFSFFGLLQLPLLNIPSGINRRGCECVVLCLVFNFIS